MSWPRLYGCVAAGSAVGAVIRYLAGLLVTGGTPVPWDTLLVNISGSLAIGLLAALIMPGQRLATHPALWHFLVPGLLAGYTTFSVFSLQTLLLFQTGHATLALLNILANIILSLIAAAVGYLVGTRFRPFPAS